MLTRKIIDLEIRGITEDQRVITGLATDSQIDRQGDRIDPSKARYASSVPLLWQHRADEPVGRAWLSPATAGLAFRAEIVKIAEPGKLKELTDLAWQAVKSRIVSTVSIGFNILTPPKPLKNGGVQFQDIEILELSLVTIPANPSAVISAVKAHDPKAQALLKAPGRPPVKFYPADYRW